MDTIMYKQNWIDTLWLATLPYGVLHNVQEQCVHENMYSLPTSKWLDS